MQNTFKYLCLISYHKIFPLTITSFYYNIHLYIGVLCNGSALGLGPSSPSSSLGAPTKMNLGSILENKKLPGIRLRGLLAGLPAVVPLWRDEGGYRIVANIRPCQGRATGSIPVTRSAKNSPCLWGYFLYP